MLPDIRDYDELYRRFRWRIPARYNIGVDVCDRWAALDPTRLAILHVHPDGRADEISYGWLKERSNRLANVLRAHGVGRGDRVAILLPQMPEVAESHIAVYKLGAVALPLAVLFGTEALAYRLGNSGARAVITNAQGARRVDEIRADLADLRLVLSVDGAASGAADFHRAVARAASDFTAADTSPDDPAMMIYTSGTTGPPKGALHGHRVLHGHLPGIEMPHDFFPQPGDRFWTPADWAWAGGLLDCLLPSLHHGVPVVARRFDKFDPEEAFSLLARAGVRNAFIPPTALRMLRSAPSPQGRHALALRTLGSGGEALGAETLEWGKSALGLVINEFYGQTECNLVLSSSALMGVSRPGAIGKPVPGHVVAVIRPDGSPAAPGELGQIAVKRPDPVMFLGYWGSPEATREKFIGDWMTTGDQGVTDDDGYFQFVGRDDDVITSSGYRIGPGEIEDCLIRHPAVALAAVIGKPDAMRTEIVKAFVVLKPDCAPTDALAADPGLCAQASLRARVPARGRLHRRHADDDDGEGDTQAAAPTSIATRRPSGPIGRCSVVRAGIDLVPAGCSLRGGKMISTRFIAAACAAAAAVVGAIGPAPAAPKEDQGIEARGRVHMRTKWSRSIGPWAVIMVSHRPRTYLHCRIWNEELYREKSIESGFALFLPSADALHVSLMVPAPQGVIPDREFPAVAKVGLMQTQVAAELTSHHNGLYYSLEAKLPLAPLVEAFKTAKTFELRPQQPSSASFAVDLDSFPEALTACLEDKSED